MIYFKQIEVGNNHNFTYIIGCKKTREAALIDPTTEIKKLLRIISQSRFNITYIILTHSHLGHHQGMLELIENLNPRIMIHKSEAKDLLGLTSRIKRLTDREIIEIGSMRVKIIHTPGHSQGSICLHVEDMLFTGDTLSVGRCGRYNIPGGNPKEMFVSINKLKKLPLKTRIYPGHRFSSPIFSSLSQELKNNPYFRVRTFQEFKSISF